MPEWVKVDWTCGWLIEAHHSTEDGPMTTVVECGAPVETRGDSAWRCENGHQHLGIEIEWALDAQREH